MLSESTYPYPEVTLTNCDREPIHIPGAIQPHGILIAIEPSGWKIVQVSRNVEEHFKLTVDDLLQKPITVLFTELQISSIKQCLAQDFDYVNPLKFERNGQIYDLIVQPSQNLIIIELELAASVQETNFFQFYASIKHSLDKMQKIVSLDEYLQFVAAEVQQLTDFDRVLVYQFSSEGHGTVVAESKNDDLEPYLGLRYPDSDIPKQAKKLYSLNPLRIIPDVDYQPVEIIPQLNSVTGEPLDLSLSVLRSVSPIHVEYLHNMGVASSMSISLIVNKKLWGLIACHHKLPKYIPYDLRNVCEFLGKIVALELGNKLNYDCLEDQLKTNLIQSELIKSMSDRSDWVDSLISSNKLLEFIDAEGAVVCRDGEIKTLGSTPSQDQIRSLLEWLKYHTEDNLFVTDRLASLYQPAQSYQSTASGVLALTISRTKDYYIVWFRPEVKQNVLWAGNPQKDIQQAEDGSIRISPRQSFAKWQELVEGRAIDWKPWEVNAAVELRSAIIGIIIRKADELAAINLELERSNDELDAFAYIASHDLKEPLRGIHNYSNFIIEDYADKIDEEGVAKLNTLVDLTKRMEELINSLLHFSRLGRQELYQQSIDLNQLVRRVVEVLQMSYSAKLDVRIPQSLPKVKGDRVLIEEVFRNLIGNGLKYNNRSDRWVEIGYLSQLPQATNQQITLYVRDNGIGIRERHLKTIFQIFKRLHGKNKFGGGNGAGLTIVKKIIERHNGKIWVESVYGQGSTFYFTLNKE